MLTRLSCRPGEPADTCGDSPNSAEISLCSVFSPAAAVEDLRLPGCGDTGRLTRRFASSVDWRHVNENTSPHVDVIPINTSHDIGLIVTLI